jgi:glutaredoxin
MKVFIKKIVLTFIFTSIFCVGLVEASTNNINAYFFYGDGCPHCAKERELLFGDLTNEYQSLKVYEYEIYNSRDNIALLQQVLKKLDTNADGVPFLVIGDKYFIGYAEGLTSKAIKQRLNECSISVCPDSVAPILGLVEKDVVPIIIEEVTNVEPVTEEKNMELPFLGEINITDFSLPLLTVIIGALDGFNPCAMWVLLFLISLLLGVKDRKRMWLLGFVFIVASASVYFLFMSAWLNLVLFLGFVSWIKILIGLLALLGGIYSIKEFIFNKASGCKVTGNEKRQRIFERMKLSVQQNSLWLAMGGIILLAFAVNLVELICSAGLPAVYTQVLALNDLAGWQYYLYILVYILFFMLDDLFIFFVAMITLEMTGITTKYARLSRLIGGLIMLIIGLLLVFRPEWLMFG